MNAKELMIGDWVQDLSPVVIDAISNEDICTYQCKDGYITVNPSNLKPLPLTAEILEKNFPSPEVVCWYPNTNSYRILIGEDAALVAINTHYVHELQHALRLCGIEKEITV